MNRRVGISYFVSLGPWLAAAILLSAASPLGAQETPEEYRKHTHFFRFILQQVSHLEFAESFAEDDDRRQWVVVVLGDPDGLNKIPGGLRDFLQRGGTVLFATDRPAMNTPLQLYHIRITGEILTCNDPTKIYRGSNACPFIEPTPNDTASLFGDPFGALIGGEEKRIATNVTSYLAPDFYGIPVLANLPGGCARVNDKWEPVERFPQEMPFAVGGTVAKGGGRLLVLADHSVFINQMMQQTDNGNWHFAFRVAKWLNESGERKRILFIEDGVPQSGVKVEQLQALPPQEMPKPSMNALVGKANEFLANLEHYDELNQFLSDKFPPRWLIRWLLILLTILLVCYGFVRFRRSRHRVDPSEPLLATAVKRTKPNASAFELRQHSLISSGNLWEPARLLAREFFEAALGGGRGSASAARMRLPRFRVEHGGLRGWLQEQRVRRLWRFAHQPLPQPVSMRQFRKLARKVADLKDAVAQGRIRFASTPQVSTAR
jgi:hypothetical protein